MKSHITFAFIAASLSAFSTPAFAQVIDVRQVVGGYWNASLGNGINAIGSSFEGIARCIEYEFSSGEISTLDLAGQHEYTFVVDHVKSEIEVRVVKLVEENLIKSVKISDWARNLSADDFHRKCGSQFVRGLQLGRSVSLKIMIDEAALTAGQSIRKTFLDHETGLQESFEEVMTIVSSHLTQIRGVESQAEGAVAPAFPNYSSLTGQQLRIILDTQIDAPEAGSGLWIERAVLDTY